MFFLSFYLLNVSTGKLNIAYAIFTHVLSNAPSKSTFNHLSVVLQIRPWPSAPPNCIRHLDHIHHFLHIVYSNNVRSTRHQRRARRRRRPRPVVHVLVDNRPEESLARGASERGEARQRGTLGHQGVNVLEEVKAALGVLGETEAGVDENVPATDTGGEGRGNAVLKLMSEEKKEGK